MVAFFKGFSGENVDITFFKLSTLRDLFYVLIVLAISETPENAKK